MTGKIGEEVLEKIEKEKISMRPRGYFVFFSMVWMVFGGLVFFFGTVALTIYLHYFNALKPRAVFINNPLTLAPILLFLAFFLVIILAIIASLLYRRGRICCRHENWMLWSAVFGGILALSFLSYGIGIFKHNVLVTEGEDLVNVKKYWSHPSQGTLSGRIEVFYPEEEKIVLYTWTNNQWQVETEDCREGREYLTAGNWVKMIGQEVGEYQFMAKRVWLWGN